MLVIAIAVGVNRNHAHVDGHIVSQVLISGNECIPIFILEADAASSTIVDTVEVFHGGHNGVRRIMRVDLHSHWYPCSDFGVLIQQELEGDVLGDGGAGRLLVRGRIPTAPIGVGVIIRRGGVPLSSSRLLVLHSLHRWILDARLSTCSCDGRCWRLYIGCGEEMGFRRPGYLALANFIQTVDEVDGRVFG